MNSVIRHMMQIRCYQIESARSDLARAIEGLGAEHPAARAAFGRLWLYAGKVPQIGLASIEAVAWARESNGSLLGRPIWNRSQRRHRQEAWQTLHAPLVSEPAIVARPSNKSMQRTISSQVQP